MAGVFLAGLGAATSYAVLRARTRALIARWSIARIATLVVIAAIPWQVVWLAPINTSVNVHTLPVLIEWLALALLAFGMIVLVPLAAVLAVGVWYVARRRGFSAALRRNDETGV